MEVHRGETNGSLLCSQGMVTVARLRVGRDHSAEQTAQLAAGVAGHFVGGQT